LTASTRPSPPPTSAGRTTAAARWRSSTRPEEHRTQAADRFARTGSTAFLRNPSY
jgi:hypothetical protein